MARHLDLEATGPVCLAGGRLFLFVFFPFFFLVLALVVVAVVPFPCCFDLFGLVFCWVVFLVVMLLVSVLVCSSFILIYTFVIPRGSTNKSE